MEEVEALLDAPKVMDEYGLRDKAMLELLYATGMRVSEIISLDIGDVNKIWDLFAVLEKEIKRESFQLDKHALTAIDAYLQEGRGQICSPKSSHGFFIFKSSWRSTNAPRILENFEEIGEGSED